MEEQPFFGNSEWFVIVNPNAGAGKARTRWPAIQQALGQSGLQFSYIISVSIEQTERAIMTKLLKGLRCFLVVGGDGTLNSTINILFNQQNVPTNQLLLCMLAVGTGNDWVKTHQLPKKYTELMALMQNPKYAQHDVGLVSIHEPQLVHKRFFINIAGFGFDARVVEKNDALPQYLKFGAITYIFALVSSLVTYKATTIGLIVDGKKLNSGLFNLNVAICKYAGGGMMFAPDAIANDGLYDVTMIKPLSKFKVVRNIARLFDGSFVKNKEVSQYKGLTVTVEAAQAFPAEADGELLPKASKYQVTLLKHAINIVVP